MSRGRPRDSHRLRVIKSPHVGKDELEAVQEPIVESITAEPPEWLHDYAKEEWGRVATELSRRSWLGAVDETIFASYCQTYARWRECEDIVDREGLVLTDEDEEKGQKWVRENPAAKLAIRYRSDMEKCAARFGITPAGRKGWTEPKPEKTGLAGFREKLG